MVSIRCHTNLDLRPCEEWPRELVCRPVNGDLISSSTGLQLEVCRCSFTFGGGLDVELHLPVNRFDSLSEFYRGYEGRNR